MCRVLFLFSPFFSFFFNSRLVCCCCPHSRFPFIFLYIQHQNAPGLDLYQGRKEAPVGRKERERKKRLWTCKFKKEMPRFALTVLWFFFSPFFHSRRDHLGPFTDTHERQQQTGEKAQHTQSRPSCAHG